MDDFNRESLSNNNDRVVRGNNDHLHYASNMKECNDVLKAGRLGKKRGIAGLFSTQSDSKVVTALTAGKTVTVLTSVTAAAAGTAVVVAGTVVVAEALSPQFEISCVYKNNITRNQVDYIIDVDKVDDIVEANYSYTVDFFDNLSGNKFNLVALTAITDMQTKATLDMSSYGGGDIYFSVLDNDGKELKNYTFTHIAKTVYNLKLTSDGTMISWTVDMINVIDLSTFKYSIRHVPTDVTEAETYFVPMTQITTVTTTDSKDATNYKDGNFILEVFQGSFVAATKTLAYVAPLEPTFNIALSLSGALNDQLDYTITIANVSDYTGYTYGVYYKPSVSGPHTALYNASINAAVTTHQVNVSACPAGILEVDVLKDNVVMAGNTLNYIPTLAPTYDVSFTQNGSNVNFTFNIQNVSDLSGYTYEVTFEDNSGTPTVITSNPITSATQQGSVNLAGYNDGVVTVNIYEGTNLVGSCTYNYVAPLIPTYDVNFAQNGTTVDYTITTTNVTDFTGYTFEVHYKVDAAPPIDEVLLTDNLTSAYIQNSVDLGTRDSGTIEVQILKSGSTTPVYTEQFAYTKPVVPTYNITFSTNGQTLTIDVTTTSITDYYGYTVTATFEDPATTNTYYLFNGIQLTDGFSRDVDMSAWGRDGHIEAYVYKDAMLVSAIFEYDYSYNPTHSLALTQYNDQLNYRIDLDGDISSAEYGNFTYRLADQSTASGTPGQVLATGTFTGGYIEGTVENMPGPNNVYSAPYYLELFENGMIVDTKTITYNAPHFECEFIPDCDNQSFAYTITYTGVGTPANDGYYYIDAYGYEADSTFHSFVSNYNLSNDGSTALGTHSPSIYLDFTVDVMRSTDGSRVAHFDYVYNDTNPHPVFNVNMTQTQDKNQLNFVINVDNVTDYDPYTYELYYSEPFGPNPDIKTKVAEVGTVQIYDSYTLERWTVTDNYADGTIFYLYVYMNGVQQQETASVTFTRYAVEPTFNTTLTFKNSTGLGYAIYGNDFDPAINDKYTFMITYQSYAGGAEGTVISDSLTAVYTSETINIGQREAGTFRLYIFNDGVNIMGNGIAHTTYEFAADPEAVVTMSIHDGMDWKGMEIHIEFYNVDAMETSNYELHFTTIGATGTKVPDDISLAGYASTSIDITIPNNQLSTGVIYYCDVRNVNTMTSIGTSHLYYTFN